MSSVQFLFVDSGTGGLPYMLRLKQISPNSKCVYVGDTLNFPYGEKTYEQIRNAVLNVVRNAVDSFNPEVVVIACNTMSVAALEVLRSNFSIPIVGTVPAMKLAASVTKNKNIGLIATKHTVEDSYTLNLINQFASDCNVIRRGDPELISFIEHHLFTASYEEKCNACRPAVEFFKEHNVDSIVLACTHFLHLYKEFCDVAGADINIVDSRDGVARQALRVLEKSRQQNSASDKEVCNVPDEAVFITSLRSDEAEYRAWCSLYKVPFMGLLG